ncbi:MAG: ankyrin repeat domain-containing protein [Treponema sp.]|nr:ankyrin repeat domain-containing protein [Treponema sp.]
MKIFKRLITIFSIFLLTAPLFASKKDDLYKAVTNNNLAEVKKILVTNSFLVTGTFDADKNTILMIAAKCGCSLDMFNVLIDAGTDVDTTNKLGQTALMFACEAGCDESVIVKLITNDSISKSAYKKRILKKDKKGKTAFDYAAEHQAVVSYLEKYTPNPNPAASNITVAASVSHPEEQPAVTTPAPVQDAPKEVKDVIGEISKTVTQSVMTASAQKLSADKAKEEELEALKTAQENAKLEKARKAEEAKAAKLEAKKKAEEEALAKKKAKEEERLAKKNLADKAKEDKEAQALLLAEERAKAEAAKRLAAEEAERETLRLAEEKRIADEKAKAADLEKARLAEEKRIADEKAKDAELEKARLAEEKRIADEKAKAAELEIARLAEEKRLADEKAKAAELEKAKTAASAKESAPSKEITIVSDTSIPVTGSYNKRTEYLYDEVEESQDSLAELKNTEVQLIKNPDLRDSQGRTRLMNCIFNDDVKTAYIMCKSGADVNAKDPQGYSCIMLCLRYSKNPQMLQLLLDNNADLLAKDNFGISTISIAAAFCQNKDVLSVYLAAADKAGISIYTGFITALKEARELEIINEFMPYVKKINALYNGKTPLMYAASNYQDTKVLKMLLEKGSDPNIISSEKKNAFSYAKENPKLVHDGIYWSLNVSQVIK